MARKTIWSEARIRATIARSQAEQGIRLSTRARDAIVRTFTDAPALSSEPDGMRIDRLVWMFRDIRKAS